MSENEIRVLYVQPGKYPEERTIPNTLRALQELVGGDIECCRPWRDSVCVICNDSGKIDGLPPNRLYGHTDFLAGSFVVCGNGGEDFISLTDRQVFLYERLYHNPVVFLPTPHGLLPMKCGPRRRANAPPSSGRNHPKNTHKPRCSRAFPMWLPVQATPPKAPPA